MAACSPLLNLCRKCRTLFAPHTRVWVQSIWQKSPKRYLVTASALFVHCQAKEKLDLQVSIRSRHAWICVSSLGESESRFNGDRFLVKSCTGKNLGQWQKIHFTFFIFFMSIKKQLLFLKTLCTTDLLTRIKATKWKSPTRDLWNIAGDADPS